MRCDCTEILMQQLCTFIRTPLPKKTFFKTFPCTFYFFHLTRLLFVSHACLLHPKTWWRIYLLVCLCTYAWILCSLSQFTMMVFFWEPEVTIFGRECYVSWLETLLSCLFYSKLDDNLHNKHHYVLKTSWKQWLTPWNQTVHCGNNINEK